MKKGLLLMAALGLPPVAFGVEPPPKEAMCRACHGVGGAAPIAPGYPKLNGQDKGYLVSSLKAYRAGERKGGMAMVMMSQATGLSDDDIEALSAYYAAQK